MPRDTSHFRFGFVVSIPELMEARAASGEELSSPSDEFTDFVVEFARTTELIDMRQGPDGRIVVGYESEADRDRAACWVADLGADEGWTLPPVRGWSPVPEMSGDSLFSVGE